MQQDFSSSGKRLRYARLYRQMSQVKLAVASGFPQPQISKWENDACRPTPRTCRQLGTVLEVAWYWIYSGAMTDPAVSISNKEYFTNMYREATPEEAERAASQNKRFRR